MKTRIKKTIIVEGRDDTTAIKRSVDALTIETHGYGIRPETWDLIAQANEKTGIIVFTDLDHAGEQIRRRIIERFPNAKEAFLDKESAEKDGDIGIENASPEDIESALAKAQAAKDESEEAAFTMQDMLRWGLVGSSGAADRRRALGMHLGVGFANSKTFLARLNKFGIKREQIDELTLTADNQRY